MMFRVPDQRHGWHGHFHRHEWRSINPRKIPWKFCVDMSIGSVSGRGVLGRRWGFLTRDMEDVVVPDDMNDVFYPKESTLKILCWNLYWKCVRKGGSRRGALGGHLWFMTGGMEDIDISDVMNDGQASVFCLLLSTAPSQPLHCPYYKLYQYLVLPFFLLLLPQTTVHRLLTYF